RAYGLSLLYPKSPKLQGLHCKSNPVFRDITRGAGNANQRTISQVWWFDNHFFKGFRFTKILPFLILTGKVRSGYPSPLVFLPLEGSNRYLCRQQTISPLLLIQPSSSAAPAWGQVAANANKVSFSLSRQICFPSTETVLITWFFRSSGPIWTTSFHSSEIISLS